MPAKEGKRQRKFGRHDRGDHHHTPEQALRNKVRRILKSNGEAAFLAFCDEHRLFSVRAAYVARRHA